MNIYMKYMTHKKSQTALFSCQKFPSKSLQNFNIVDDDDDDNVAVDTTTMDDAMYIANALTQLLCLSNVLKTD